MRIRSKETSPYLQSKIQTLHHYLENHCENEIQTNAYFLIN